MDLGAGVPEQVRVHLKTGIAQDRAAELRPESAARLRAPSPARKELVLTGAGEMNEVLVAILLDQRGGFGGKGYIDDPSVLGLMFLEDDMEGCAGLDQVAAELERQQVAQADRSHQQ